MRPVVPATAAGLLLALPSCGGDPEPCPETACPAPDETGLGETGEPLPDGVFLDLDHAQADECAGFCGHVAARSGGEPVAGATWRLESDRDGFLEGATGTLGDDGRAGFCVAGPVTPGAHRLAAHVEGHGWDEAGLVVEPFGSGYGLDLPREPLEEVPWIPVVQGLSDEPVLRWGEEGTWDDLSVMMPSTVVHGDQRLLYYAGTPAEDFRLGIATRGGPGEAFSRYAGNPVLADAEPGDWKHLAQNTPEALVVDGEVWLYYNGRSGESGGLSIGLATSPDGLLFEDHPDNPVFSPTGDDADFDGSAVAHPSVIARDGVLQLWYASGSLEIGYALSRDGLRWERYCGNPVFTGDESSWDRGHVKAPEVVRHGDTWFMTYSGCGQGCYEVGWAASADGVRWVAAGEPIIPRQPGPAWNSYGTQAAFVEVDGDTWRFWYTGTGEGHGAIGLGTAEGP